MLRIYRKLDPTRKEYMTLDPKFFVGTAIWPLLLAIQNSSSPSNLSPTTYAMLSLAAGIFGLKVGTVYHSWKRWLQSWRIRWGKSKSKSRSKSRKRAYSIRVIERRRGTKSKRKKSQHMKRRRTSKRRTSKSRNGRRR